MLVNTYKMTGRAPPLDRQDIYIWFSGFSTVGVIDGAVFHPKGPVRISGTEKYSSAGGASRTVLLATAFDPSEYLEPVKKSDAGEIDTFLGRWRIMDENFQTVCFFTIDKSFTAKKTHVPNATAKWEIVGDDARITWSDGWKDILRPEKGGMLKIAFGPGTSWDDKPANTQRAIRE